MAELSFTPSQDRAIHCIEKNVVVSAGAGSGKTRVLVQRFLHILGRGIANPADTVLPEEIAAVTFTRKAAAEMRDRIREEMEKHLSAGQDRAYWEQQLKALPRAQIGTIHSFCSSLLRSNPAEAGLDPDFTVMEETDYSEFLAAEVRKMLRRLLHEQDPSAGLLCEEYGSRSLQEQTIALLQKGIVFTPGSLTAKYQEILDETDREAEQLQTLFTPEFAAACSPVNRTLLEPDIEKIRSALTDVTEQEHHAFLRAVSAGLQKKGKNKEEVAAVKQRLDFVLSRPLCQKAIALIPAWETFLLRIRADLKKKKQELALLAFDDLEEMALSLLEEHPDILKKCLRQFRYIMVDEFQDTNERQRQLVYLLCGGDKNVLRGHRLFVVGDAKQSIYRFRGADVSVFARVRNEIAATGGELIRLNDNFRTVDTVLHLCNDVFPGLMGTGKTQDVYYEPLQSHRQTVVQPHFCVHHYDAKKIAAAEARAVEADRLAVRLSALHGEGLAYKHMAILLQNMTHVSVLTEALRKHGVPYAVVDGRGFYDRMEFQDLLNLFSFAVNPHDNINLSGILRSVYMGLDDDSLTRIHLALAEANRRICTGISSVTETKTDTATVSETGTETAKILSLWDFLQRKQAVLKNDAEPMLKRAVAILRQVQIAGSVLNLPDFCREIQKLLHPEAVLAMQHNGEEQLANLRKFFRLAQEFAAQKQGSQQDFVLRMTRLQQEKDREAAATVVAEDAVQVMTVHKSKGLEFPLVAIPFTDTPFKTDTLKAIWHSGLGLGISVRDPEGNMKPSELLLRIRKDNTVKEQEEKIRLLYVAMTRAKDRLLLSGCLKDTKKTSEASHWLNWLDRNLQGTGAEREDLRAEHETVAAEPALPAQPEEFTPEVMAAFLQAAAPLDSYGGRGMNRFSASSLQTYGFCPRRYYYQYIENIPALDAGEKQGETLPADVVGTLVHEVLEKYAGWRMEHRFAEDDRIWHAMYEKAVQELAGGRFDLAKEAETMLQEYLRSNLYQSFSQKQIAAEYRFQLPLLQDGEHMYTITGIIDAVAENENGGLEIIDYKSGKPPQENAMDTGYAWQLTLYRMALEHLLQLRGKTSLRVEKASLHYLQDRSERVLPAKDYRQEIVQVCREIAEKKCEEEFTLKTDHCTYCPFVYLCKRK